MSAATGRVTSQESRIWDRTFLSAVPLINPMPVIAPTETWVVESGSPIGDALMTSAAVTILAVTACRSMQQIFLLIVWATFRALSRPPIAIAIAIAITL